jgi:hypothetical protein
MGAQLKYVKIVLIVNIFNWLSLDLFSGAITGYYNAALATCSMSIVHGAKSVSSIPVTQ